MGPDPSVSLSALPQTLRSVSLLLTKQETLSLCGGGKCGRSGPVNGRSSQGCGDAGGRKGWEEAEELTSLLSQLGPGHCGVTSRPACQWLLCHSGGRAVAKEVQVVHAQGRPDL